MPTGSIEIDQKYLEQLGRAVVALAAQTDNRSLLDTLLSAALQMVDCEAGAVYLLQSPGLLCCEAAQAPTCGQDFNSEELAELLPVISIHDANVSAKPALSKAFLEGNPVLIDDVNELPSAFTESPLFKDLLQEGKPLLSVPLSGQGLLLLVSCSRAFCDQEIGLLIQLGISAGSFLRKNKQLEEQKTLFESTIQMIAGAVDEKFYLGVDHCRRVPVLTMMLAHAVNKSSEPPFADQQFSEQELYELEVAAWLHDCGKLVTPISLIEKSRKLETVFDRIELIQTRFEIIRRDEEIARLRAGRGSDEFPIKADGNDNAQQMLEDLHFLAESNHGTKTMTAVEQKRIKEIAERYRWVDRQMEEVSVLSGDEVDNLTIASGTINNRERVKINNHALATIGMLDLLPFPDELQHVPDIVSGYQQERDGRLLLQARILALADLFVSVTTQNRSYRKSNNLEEALEALLGMKEEKGLDADLINLFLCERLHQQYAAEFLSAEQSGILLPE